MTRDQDENSPKSSDNEQFSGRRKSAAFRNASFHPPEEIWSLFTESETCCDIIDYFEALKVALNVDTTLHGIEFYEVLKSKLTSWKCQSLWDLLNARLKHKEYSNGTVAKGHSCIIIGSGPIGLRMAIETLLLGCKTVIVEKRTEFSRNNVLHLWPFLLTDFRALGAKKFYGKFGAGCIEHINIKTLQCVLLKIALILGLEIHVGVTFKHLVEPTEEKKAWTASYQPENHEVSKYKFDIIISADGKKNVLPGFPQIELRGALAIGITCNFVNNNTIEEAGVPEISGISYQYNPKFFNDMEAEYGVKLENIVYYKDETHYFVMTALKSSLLNLGAIREDIADPTLLLEPSNIDKERLIEFAQYAVNHATNHQLPEDLEFKKLSNGNPDIALFDFTSIKKAANASRIIDRKNQRLMVALVGDSLIEPFWPTGSGAGRGVLSALDVAWMVRQFALKNPPLAILRERENIFKLLSGTTNDSLQKNYKDFTIDPKTRYKGFDTKRVSNMTSLKGLYDTDDRENADYTIASPSNDAMIHKPIRKRTSSGGGIRKTSTHLHHHASKPKRKSDRASLKDQAIVGNTKEFWEEHNQKNVVEREKSYVSKNKKSVTSVGSESSIEELSELDDDVIEDAPVVKKGFKSPFKSLKRQASQDSSKVLKRQSTKDNLHGTKKGVYQAKGGGLKSKNTKERKTSEKEERTRTKSSSEKRSGSQSKKQKTPEKTQTSVKTNPPRPVDPRNFFRKWLETLKQPAKESKPIEEDVPQALHVGSQTAAIAVLALPLLFDCNRPPRRRTTDIKIKDIQTAKDSFLNPNTLKETHEITVQRAGSVKNAIQKYKLLEQKDKKDDNYYDFLKRQKNSDRTDGFQTVNNDEEEDFSPKDVIDVEKALLHDEIEESKRSKLGKSTWCGTGTESSLQLQLALEEFCDAQTPFNSVLMLQVLYNIHKRIENKPEVDKYYRVYTKGDIFERHVWLLHGAEKYLSFAGWVKCGNYIILSKAYPVKQSVKVIEEVLRKKKKAQLLYSGSVQSQPNKPDISVRRARSNVGDSTIDEDEVVASFTSISGPANETDSAIGSGFEDDDEIELPQKHRLRRVESKEHVMGNEEYIVIDFIGNLEVSSRKSSKVESPKLSLDSPETNVGLAAEKSDSGTSAYEEVFSPTPVTEESGFQSADSSAHFSPVEKPKKVFSAGGGLKRAKKEKQENQRTEEASKQTKSNYAFSNRRSSNRSMSPESTDPRSTSPETISHRSTSPETISQRSVSPETVSQRSVSPGTVSQRSISPESVSQRSTSPEVDDTKRSSSKQSSMRGSPRQERSSSLRSNSSDTGKTGSLVMQNKLLFDQQIAENLKKKYPSTQSLNAPLRRSQLDLSNFEKPKTEYSRSFNERRNLAPKTSGEVDTSGMVAGALGIFGGGKVKSRPSSFQQKDADKPVIHQSVAKSNSATEPVKSTDASSNPLLSNYKSYNVTATDPTKKKKFPFKKHKTDKQAGSKKSKKKDGNVELVSVKDNPEGFEERAIDVPHVNEAAKPEEESSDKKKKGLFSRIRKSRKSSDSDHERKTSTDLDVLQGNDKIAEKEEVNQDEENDINVENDVAINTNVDITVSTIPDIPTTNNVDLPNESVPENTQYSSDVASVLGNIIDRNPSFNDEQNKGSTTGKKKRLGLKKKKRSSNVDKHKDVIESNVLADNPSEGDNLEQNGVKESNKSVDAGVSEARVPSHQDIRTESNEFTLEKESSKLDIEISQKENKTDNGNISDDEEVVTAVIRTDKLISDWSFDTEDLEEEIQSEIHATHEESIPEESPSEIKAEPQGIIVEEQLQEIRKDSLSDVNIAGLPNETSVDLDTQINNNFPEATSNTSNELVNGASNDATAETSSIATSELSASVNGGDDLVNMLDEINNDDLVNMLEEASNQDNQSMRKSDTCSIDEQLDEPEKEKKKKKKFRFPLKRNKKEKQKKDLSESVPESLDDASVNIPEKKSKKSKRPKSLEITTDATSQKTPSRPSSMSQEEFENDVVDGKKKKLSFFRKKKIKSDSSSPNKEASFIAYTDNYPSTTELPEEKDDNKSETTKVMLSSDEFTIPENTSHPKHGHKEFIKNGGELIEIKTSVEMEF